MAFFCKCSDLLAAFKKSVQDQLGNMYKCYANHEGSIQTHENRLKDLEKKVTEIDINKKMSQLSSEVYSEKKLTKKITLTIARAVDKIDERLNKLEKLEIPTMDMWKRTNNDIIKINQELEYHIALLLKHINKHNGFNVPVMGREKEKKLERMFKNKIETIKEHCDIPKRRRGKPRKVKNEQETEQKTGL